MSMFLVQNRAREKVKEASFWFITQFTFLMPVEYDSYTNKDQPVLDLILLHIVTMFCQDLDY